MLNRIAIIGLVVFFVAAEPLSAAKRFPHTAEDYAVVYELQLYEQLRGNSAEYRRRINVAQQVVKDFKKNGSKKSYEPMVIQWFVTASQSGSYLPPVPYFGKSSQSSQPQTVATPQTYAPKSYAPKQAQPAQPAQPVKPEFDWDQQSAATEATPPTQHGPSSSSLGVEDLPTPSASAANDSDAWSASEVDEAFGITSPTNGEQESFVTADPRTTSVLKKGSAAVSKGLADAGDDLSDIWEDVTTTPETPNAQSLAALGSEAAAEFGNKAKSAVEALPTFSMDKKGANGKAEMAAKSQGAEGEGNLSDVWDKTIEAANAKGANLPALGNPGAAMGAVGGSMPALALMGAGLLNGIVSFICMLKTLFVSFKKKPLFGIISLLTCGFAAFIIGWMKHKEWGLSKTMKVWTGCLILGFILQVAAGFVSTMG